MRIINVFEAKTRLSELLQNVLRGETIILGKHGQPIAMLVPYSAKIKNKKRKLGGLKGKYWMSDDFDAPLPLDLFLGKEEF